MASENLRDLRWTLDSVVRTIGRTGREVIIVDRDGVTELAAIISMSDYERLHEYADDVDALRFRAEGGDDAPEV